MSGEAHFIKSFCFHSCYLTFKSFKLNPPLIFYQVLFLCKFVLKMHLYCHVSSDVHMRSLSMQHLLGLCTAGFNNSHKAQGPFSFYEPPVAVEGSSDCLYHRLPRVPSSQSFLIWQKHATALFSSSLTSTTRVLQLLQRVTVFVIT